MRLKRIYDWNAPSKKWTEVKEKCVTCDGKGVVVNETLDGVVDCPDCEKGVRIRQVPPVSGVEIQRTSPVQHFSPRVIAGGQQEGWLSMQGANLVIQGVNKTLTYQINRYPGKQSDGETINYYDCELVKES